MLYYVEILVKNSITNKLQSALGSDGYLLLDGRLKLKSMIINAERYLQQMQSIKPQYIAFNIRKGNSENSHIIYNSENSKLS